MINNVQFWSFLRRILLAVGSGLATKGNLDSGTLWAIVGAVITILTAAYGLYVRRKATAAALPEGRRLSPRERSRRRSTILRPSWLTVERAASVTITELLGFILSVCGAGGALWFRIESAIRAARADAMLAAAAATAKADVLATALGEFRVHVAETYVSKQWLREQVGQVMDLLRDVQNDVELRQRAARPRDRRPAGAAWRPNQDFLIEIAGSRWPAITWPTRLAALDLVTLDQTAPHHRGNGPRPRASYCSQHGSPCLSQSAENPRWA